jgi:hypothetical protein
VKKLVTLPPGCRRGHNSKAFVGGFVLWQTGKSAIVRLCKSSLPACATRCA